MSAFPGDGRSYIAAHLAVALAEKGPALLVAQSADAATLTGRIDARRNGSAGAVPDALKDTARSTDYPGLYFHALQHTGGGLSEIVAQASAAGFHTVVDSPSALTSSNAFLLAREVGNVIYVVTEKVQDLDVHRQIRDQLNRLGVGILGLVLNRG
jgi:Mrp family chromosome partitioning ATPase